MTSEETKAAAATMLAHAEGKAIEYRMKGTQIWRDCPQPVWNLSSNEYRVKREPWSGKIWLHADDHTASYCKSDPEKFMLKNGYRLIEVKEVMP
jgi:hypothetical protein